MGEEGGDAGGKTGLSRKLVAGIIVTVVVVAGVGAAIWWDMQNNGGAGSSQSLIFYFDTEYSDAEWRITIVDVFLSTINYTDPDRTFYETYIPPLKDNNSFANIRDTPSPFGICWHDANNDNLVNIGDYLTVNRSGGSGGKLEAHNSIKIWNDYDGSPDIYLPPADLLDMDVVKTSTGWNMTVTWVNRTIPEGFMSDYNLTFRVENGSGEYFAGGEPGCDVNLLPEDQWRMRLRFIDSSIRNVSDVNYNYHDRAFYNITWFDNDDNQRLSVNDSIEIENYSGLVETGYRFRLICDCYGFIHTIAEWTLT